MKIAKNQMFRLLNSWYEIYLLDKSQQLISFQTMSITFQKCTTVIKSCSLFHSVKRDVLTILTIYQKGREGHAKNIDSFVTNALHEIYQKEMNWRPTFDYYISPL